MLSEQFVRNSFGTFDYKTLGSPHPPRENKGILKISYNIYILYSILNVPAKH